jgi:CheY-like chemotaxis protein
MTRPFALLVDDHPLNLKLLRATLAARGIETRSAQNAEETWAALEVARPAVILMDVQLPGIDGLTLTRAIRRDGRFEGLPIVAVTAYAMDADQQAALDAGCDAFMAKPIDVRALGELVTKLMNRSSNVEREGNEGRDGSERAE